MAEHNLKTAAEGFEAIEVPITVKDVSHLSNTEVATLLPQLNIFTNWIKAVEAYALHELEQGREVPGYKLVTGRSIRKWRNEADAEKALRASKLKVAEIFTKKLISPTQAEKALGKSNRILQEQVIKPEGRPALAPLKDKRPALEVSPTEGFSQVV